MLNNSAFTFVTAAQAGYPPIFTPLARKTSHPGSVRPTGWAIKLFVRGGYGIFYDFTPPQGTPSDLFNVLENFAPNKITAGVPLYQFPNPFTGQSASAVGTLGASSYAKNLRMPYTQQWNLTFERQIVSSVAWRLVHWLAYGRAALWLRSERSSLEHDTI